MLVAVCVTGICVKPEFKIIGWIYIYNTSIFLSLGSSCFFSLALKGRGFLRCLIFAIPCCLPLPMLPLGDGHGSEAPWASWRVLCLFIFLPPSRPMPPLLRLSPHLTGAKDSSGAWRSLHTCITTEEMKPSRTLWGPPTYKSFPRPLFLVCRK